VVVAASVGLLAACTSAPSVEIGPTSTPTTAPVPSSSSSFVPAPADPRLDTFYGQKLVWRTCGGDFQCAGLAVPLSYDSPASGQITVQVLRYKASDQSHRLGSLVVNPGGPGGSGLDYARAARAITTDAIRARYDIVGFDPRGVGTSDPIHCLDDKQTDAFVTMDASPDTPSEVAIQATQSAAFGKACLQRSPSLVPNVGTREVAKDLDILRAALGDQKLTYLGKSYGTFIGATYAELFPQNVGRMVLDGALDPALDGTELAHGQALGFELALRRFVEKCPSLDGCPLPADPTAALAKISGLLDRIDATPMTAEPGRPLTQALAVLGIVGSLYDNADGWPTLAYALQAAFQGDGSVLLSTADYFTDRDTNGHYTTNGNDALYAVNCWDKPATPGVSGTQALAAQWAAQAPHFGAYLAWGNLPCATWPAHTTVAPHAVTADSAPPILVVGTTFDPATPVQWAKSLAGELAKGVYLEWHGDGHTAYQRGSSCIDAKVDAYFLRGTPPVTGTVCP
jgi:pimeloyl-ACP methyl ester carboxylesterase